MNFKYKIGQRFFAPMEFDGKTKLLHYRIDFIDTHSRWPYIHNYTKGATWVTDDKHLDMSILFTKQTTEWYNILYGDNKK
jgi:hypothetical protein